MTGSGRGWSPGRGSPQDGPMSRVLPHQRENRLNANAFSRFWSRKENPNALQTAGAHIGAGVIAAVNIADDHAGGGGGGVDKLSAADKAATRPSPTALETWRGSPVQSPAANTPGMLVAMRRST